MVQMYAPLAAPHLTKLVRSRLPKVMHHPRKFKYFKKYSQLDDKAARKALSLGTKPSLSVKDLGPGVFGEYPGRGDVIQINSTINGQYEQMVYLASQARKYQSRWKALLARAELIIEAVVTHEMVHWGDEIVDHQKQDHKAQRLGWKDWGHKFVRAAYGKQFTYKSGYAGRYKVKVPNMDIHGWLGWAEVERGGRRGLITYDPTYEGGPSPVVPPEMNELVARY